MYTAFNIILPDNIGYFFKITLKYRFLQDVDVVAADPAAAVAASPAAVADVAGLPRYFSFLRKGNFQMLHLL